MGGALFCSITYPSPCPGIRITNNICAGTVQQAFTGPAHNCDSKNTNFYGNVAHSINGGFSGNGFVVYPDPSNPKHKECYEVSNNAAYKVADAGVFTNFPAKRVQMHSVTVIDANIGAGAMASVMELLNTRTMKVICMTLCSMEDQSILIAQIQKCAHKWRNQV